MTSPTTTSTTTTTTTNTAKLTATATQQQQQQFNLLNDMNFLTLIMAAVFALTLLLSLSTSTTVVVVEGFVPTAATATATATTSLPRIFTSQTIATTATTTTTTSLNAEKKKKDGGGGIFGALTNMFEELDAFMDDATARRLGNGAAYYGKRKSSFYGTSDKMKKSDKDIADSEEDYMINAGGNYKWITDENGVDRPVSRMKGNSLEKPTSLWGRKDNNNSNNDNE
jgi:hypothetical protein